MMPLIPDSEIDRWLAEDVPFGDLTTHALGIGERPGRMVFEARDAMVVAADWKPPGCWFGLVARWMCCVRAVARSKRVPRC